MRFAATGLDHIYDLTEGLLDAGATCAGYWPQTTAAYRADGLGGVGAGLELGGGGGGRLTT